MKSKPLSPPPAICGSNITAQNGSLFLPVVMQKHYSSVDDPCSRLRHGRWNEPVYDGKEETDIERRSWPGVTADNCQLGSVKGKVAQVLLGLWPQRCAGATAHRSIKGDYRDTAICCKNKHGPFYVSVCMFVRVLVRTNPPWRCTFNLKGSTGERCELRHRGKLVLK